MPLYSDKELEQLPAFQDVEEALRNPEQVIRLLVYRHQDASALARVAELRNLQSLSISLADVSLLLPRLSELKDLQTLYLQACDIPTFPESLLELPNLRSLSIGNSSLSNLPEEIGRLGKLEELRFAQNRLRQIPTSIGQLALLETLGLFSNRIEALPDSIGDLAALVWLLLDSNRLVRLPESIGKLARLQTLSVDCNVIRTLPGSICQLTALEILSIKGNPFESLPKCLTTMPGIKELTIEAEKRSLFMDWSYRPSNKPPRVELADLKLFVESDSPFHTPLLAAIDESGLAEFGPAIVRSAREAVQIESTVPDDYSLPGSSRLGGFPDLPDSTLFPTSDDGRYWIFLAQLDLQEIAPHNGRLPRSGLLSFFLDSTEALHAKVLFYEDDLRTLATIRHGGADEMLAPDDDYTQSPHRVKFQRFYSLPHVPPEGIERYSEPYEKCRASSGGGDHHLNGYTFTQHESPQHQAANELGGQPDEWVPLLQLGWDNKVGFCFWDAGTLTFTIHQEDLRRCDFSRVYVSLETS